MVYCACYLNEESKYVIVKNSLDFEEVEQWVNEQKENGVKEQYIIVPIPLNLYKKMSF